MKKAIRKTIAILIMITMVMGMIGCGGASKVSIDYADAESFEAALNAGENLEGKVVQFVAGEIHPDSALGFNVWAGEHLNFVSSRNPDIKEGDTVIVKTTTIENIMGSWIINYEKVANTEVTDATTSAGTGSASFDINGESSDPEQSNSSNGSDNSGSSASFASNSSATGSDAKALEITDYGWYINDVSYGDSAYVEFCAMIHNPNTELIAEFPKVLVTVRNTDGTILATGDQTGSIVMPEDTVTLCGLLSVPIADVTDDTQIQFDVDWSDFSKNSSFYKAVRCSDFTFTNVSEHNGSSENLITGDVTNNSEYDIDMGNISIVMRKDGKIVYMENTFVDGLRSGQSKTFQFQRFEDWPEHDTIECSAMPWM